MKDDMSRYMFRIDQILYDKLAYISKFEIRTKNKEMEQLIKRRIYEFERVHGKIETNENKGSSE